MPFDSALPLDTNGSAGVATDPGGSGEGHTDAADEALADVRRVLSGGHDAFQSLLASAIEEARRALGTLRPDGDGRAARSARELGGLSRGPVDAARFARLLLADEPAAPLALEPYARALGRLEQEATRWDLLVEVLGDGQGSLRDAVASALARRGRIWGAARVLARFGASGASRAQPEDTPDALPFAEWRALERRMAPPLLVSTPGEAMQTAAGLAEFLDGAQKIVLLVSSPCPPAPLARLIQPGALVLQACEASALQRALDFAGPAVAALVPSSAAQFLFDPEDGPLGRLTVSRLPASPPRSWLGGMSPAQQGSELRLLEAWARASAEAPTSAAAAHEVPPPSAARRDAPSQTPAPASPPDPVERLAAWLIGHAELGSAAG